LQLMAIKQILKQLNNSKEFKQWGKKHPKCYIAHFLKIMNKEESQIGYYNPENDTITTFLITPEQISTIPDQKIMKTKQEISKLETEKIQINSEQALKTAKKCIKENYTKEIILKSFFILQQINNQPMYNLTYLTQGFKTINIKINAIDGKVVKHTIGVIADFS